MKFKEFEKEFSYSGIPTFYKFPHTTELCDVDIALVGVPFDQGTTNRPGTRFGPRSIRIASQSYGIYYKKDEGFYNLEIRDHILKKANIIDYGDIHISPTSITANMKMIHNTFKEITNQNIFPVAFGGDHSIMFPIVDSFDSDIPIDIVHFDTHLDFLDNIAGMKFSHANPIKRVSELENVNHITQIGIRGFTDEEFNFREAEKYGSKVITANEVFENGISWMLEQIPEAENIYATFDIDVLDPSVAPGTGTPEPGGFNYNQMQDILTKLPKKGNIIGFDLVEVNPLYDPAEITSHVAARLTLDFMGAIF